MIFHPFDYLYEFELNTNKTFSVICTVKKLTIVDFKQPILKQE